MDGSISGITLRYKTGRFSTLRWRYISSRPLTEDGAFQAPPLNVVNGRVGYQFANGWRIQLDALNLLNSSNYNATYAYGALLPSDSLSAMCFPAHSAPTAPAAVRQNGVRDYSVHPMEPLAFRLTLAGPIDTINLPAMAAELRRAIPTTTLPPRITIGPDFIGAHADGTWSKTSGTSANTATGAAFASVDGNTSRWGAAFSWASIT